MTNFTATGENSVKTGKRTFGVVAFTAGVLIVAVLGAAVGGAWEIEQRFDLMPNLRAIAPTTTEVEPPPNPNGDGILPRTFDMTWVVIVVNVLFLLLVVAALYRIWRIWWGRIRKHQYAADFDPAYLAPDLPDLPVMKERIEAAKERLLTIADPNDAIVAAWLELEEAAGGSGVRRHPAQTPAEFTMNVLAATGAEPEAARGLLRLYERARFSEHSSSPEDVSTANLFLERLLARWVVDATPRKPGE